MAFIGLRYCAVFVCLLAYCGTASTSFAQAVSQSQQQAQAPIHFSELDLPQQKETLARLSDEQVRAALLEILTLDSDSAEQARRSLLNVSQINRNFLIFKEGLKAGTSAIPRVPELFKNYLDRLFPDWKSTTGLKLIFGFLFVFFLGWVAEYYYIRRTAPLVEQILNSSIQRFSHRILLLAKRLFIRLIGIIIFAVVSLLAYFIFAPAHEPLRIALLAYLFSVVLVRTVMVCSKFLFAPQVAALRVFPISCADAKRIYWLNVFLALYCGVFLMTEFIMKQLELNQLLIAAWGTLFGQLFALLMVISTWIIRRPIREILMEGVSENTIAAFIYQNWHWLASFALIMVNVIASYALILENRNVVVPAILTDVIIISVPILIAIVKKLIDDSFGWSDADVRQADSQAYEQVDLSGEVLPKTAPGSSAVRRQSTTPMLSGLSGITSFLIGIAALMLVFAIWGYRVDEVIRSTLAGQIISSFVGLIVIIAVAYVLWVIASYFMDPYLPDAGISGPGDEAGGTGVSRISTLMPILKKILLGMLVMLVIMIYLSQLGVDIGPLLAGAGIIGIAIGFGAQTLVKDVISGMFYLIDDAFRKGEYIEIGDIRGTVENISIRSFQLRHHNGPVHTVPYGDITSLTNYSRDWVIMKFEIRIPFETDVEMVRKLIKKVGAEMLEDEEFKPMLIDQLKSQGVNRMDDSALIVRCKFTCHPGHQFYLRRVAYAKIQKAFENKGIQFAPRRVIVEAQTPELVTAGAATLDQQQPDKK